MSNVQISEAFSALEALEKTSGRIEKENILKLNKYNQVLTNMFYMTYNPNILFFMKKVPKVTKGAYNDNYEGRYKQFCDILNKLSNRDIVGNEALEVVKSFLNMCSSDEIYWYSKVLQKDLKVGVTEKTLNKIYGEDFIPVFSCMLAESFKDFKQLPDEFYEEPKLDGYRLLTDTSAGALMKSRNGKLIEGFTELEEVSSKYLPSGYVFDSEITAGTFNGVSEQAFKKTAGKKGVINVFDVIPAKEFAKRECSMSQIERKKLLSEIMLEVSKKTELIQLVPNSRILRKDNPDDIEEMNELYTRWCSQGYEGGMIKDAHAPYIYDRTGKLLKIKPMKTFDLKVVEVFEGEGKYEGMLGGVYVDYNGEKVGVGSGFSDTQRRAFWSAPNTIIGHIIEMQAQEETNNKQGTHKLRFTSFKHVRYDK